MHKVGLVCRNATTFSANGEFDEAAFRLFLGRLVESGVGVYLGSGGSGEGHALTDAELDRVYRVAVSVCKGKVPVNANIPEHFTAAVTKQRALAAAAAGVDLVNVYGPAGWHAYRPTDDELTEYYDEVLHALDHPVALAPLPVLGYTPKPALIAAMCHKYEHVTTVNLAALGEAYFLELKAALRRDVAINVPLNGAIEALSLGAAGIVSAAANVLPKTHRRYVDLYEQGRIAECCAVYAELMRFDDFTAKWGAGTARWIKAAMRVMRIPGWEGGVRRPYRMLEGEQFAAFRKGLLGLGIAEIDEAAA